MSEQQENARTALAWHAVTVDEAVSQLQSDAAAGLDSTQVEARRAGAGPNTIVERQRRSWPTMFIAQFKDFMILVLLAAALVSGIIGEVQDTIAILVIVLLNAVIGAVQEFRAERAVAALRELSAPVAQVIRDGKRTDVASAEVVPGDLVLIEAGNIVPADLRLVRCNDLQLDESALTGEAQGVRKTVDPVDGEAVALSERVNIAYKSTLVHAGRGMGVAVATGMATEIGQIAALLNTGESVRTPLQVRLAGFGRNLAVGVLAVCVIVFVTGLLQGQPALLMFLTAISLAVAAIPEALPAVITVSLAFGARGLSRNNALVRRLPAVETLGSVTYICADKTGTLTENRMRAEHVVMGGHQFDSLPDAASCPLREEMGLVLTLCNDVNERDGAFSGDPTEVALYELAHSAGFNRLRLEQEHPRLAEIPFDSNRQAMTTLHAVNGTVWALVKGAPEAVLPMCRQSPANPGSPAFNAQEILHQASELAGQGHRVLAFAKRSFTALPDDVTPQAVERELDFLGLVALIDPPRAEAKQAVAECRAAGITPVMITGDHPATAGAIAGRLGILDEDGTVLTGSDLSRLSDDALRATVKSVRVFARVSPAQKTRIVKALQDNGEFVAMTGDGVNDAPALKQAGIGVAMGLRGTDVARQAADMVLLDDNFATIVNTVRSGRRIFDNIRKFIKYTMSSNSGEIWTLFLAPFLGLPVPLLPIHILWINLLTDGLPGLALSTEPAEPGIMQRAPRPPGESIVAHGMWQHIVWVGLLIGGLSLAAQAWSLGRGDEYWQTVVFTVLTVSQLFHSIAVRSERASLAQIGLLSNPALLGAVALMLGLQLAVIYVPQLNPVFHTQPLPLFDLLVCLTVSSLVLVAVEVEKCLVRRGLIYQDQPER